MPLRQHSFFARPSIWLGGFGVLLVSVLCACGGGGVSSTPVVTTQSASLPAAIATGCIAQSGAAQTATLPAAGGVSGSISLGATATGGACLGVTVATGADATLSATRTTTATRRSATATATAAPSPLPPALAQVSLTNTYTGNLTWVAMTLQLPPGTVPAGQYPATITSTNDIDGTVDTSVANFTVTVSATGQAVVTGPSASHVLAILAADTTGVLAIYPPGTVLPTPSQLPLTTPSPTPSASGTPTASPSPTASPTTAPTQAPSSSPTVVPTTAALMLSISPKGCIDAGNTGPTFSYTATVSAPPPSGAVYLYHFFPSALYASRWTVTVSPVTINSPTYGPLSTSNTASITAPIYATVNDITGESGGMEVSVFYYYPSVGSYYAVQDSTGHTLYAASTIAAGTITCANIGF